MAKQTVGLGSTANDGTGDGLRVAFDKINDNTNELYTALGDGSTLGAIQRQPSEGAFANGDKTKLDGIEASADVTDTANVTAAGALMDSEVTNLAQVKAFDSSDYATAAQGALADSATQPGDLGNLAALDTITESLISDLGAYLTDITGEDLSDLADVNAGAPTDGQVLAWDDATSRWIASTAAGGGGDAWSDAVDADIVPDADGTRDLGSATNRFASLHVDSIDLNGVTLDGTTLADPGADRLLFWDDSAGATAYLTAGSGLSISGTTITATGGSGLADVVDDTTPQLGGDLDGQGNEIANYTNAVVTDVSGTLTVAAHSGNAIVTSGNVTVPTTAGFSCTIIAGGAHTVSFNSTTSAAMATGDVMTVVVESSTVIHAVLTAAADKVGFS